MYHCNHKGIKMAVIQYPENLGSSSEYKHYIQFTAVPRANTQGVSDHVLLYLPAEALKASYKQTFGDADLGAVGAALSTASPESAASAFNPLAGVTTNPLSAIRGVLGGAGQLAGELNMSSALQQAAVNEAVKKAEGINAGAVAALKKKAGKIVNPHKAVIYQGPGGFRVFNFTFNMSPQSKREAESIARIVHYFKYYMHPGVPQFTQVAVDTPSGRTNETRATGGQVGNINSSLTLTFPEEFKIAMFVRGKKTGMEGFPSDSTTVTPLFKIKKSVLESLNVDYSTSGGAAFITDDGIEAPATTSLTLQFKETELMTKQSITQGF